MIVKQVFFLLMLSFLSIRLGERELMTLNKMNRQSDSGCNWRTA